jgi:hypothetical protein
MLKNFIVFCFGFLLISIAFSSPIKLNQSLEKTWNAVDPLQISHAGSITITGNGTIRFLQLTYYSDTSCSTLLGSGTILDNATGFKFSDGHTVLISAPAAYQLANDQGITPSDVACIKMYLDGGSQSPYGVSCQSFNDAVCDGSTCVSNQIKSVNWIENPAACTAYYAYVANKKNSTISKCLVSPEDGTLSECNTTGDNFKKPTGIALNNGYAAISNQQGNTITKCAVSASDGTLSNCTSTGSGFNQPFEVLYDTAYVYASNKNASTISKCDVSPTDGSFSIPIANGVANLR